MKNFRKFIICVFYFLIISSDKAFSYLSTTKRFHLFLDPRTWNAAYSQCESPDQRLVNLDDDFKLIEVKRLFTTGAWKDVRPREFWVAMHLDYVTNNGFIWSSTCNTDTAIEWGSQEGYGNLDLQCVYMSMESENITLHKADCIATSKFYVCEEACTDKLEYRESTMESPLKRMDVSVMDCTALCKTLSDNSVSCKGFTYARLTEMCSFHFPGDSQALFTSTNIVPDKDIHVIKACTTIDADIYTENCTKYPVGPCPNQQTYGACPFSDGSFQNQMTQINASTSGNSFHYQGTILSTETINLISTTQPEGSSNEDFEKIIKEMKVHHKETSKYRRTLVSASDPRPVSRYFGYIGVVVMVTVVLLIVLCDILTFYIPTTDNKKLNKVDCEK